jgi:predicted aspartyl protease
MSKKPFYESGYKNCDGCFRPIMKILCHFERSDVPFEVMADTGCDSGFVLLKDQVKDLELGERKNDNPIEIGVADGHIVGADMYIITVEVGQEKREITLLVVDPTNIIRQEEIEESVPVIGREFLDCFDVLFQGEKKKLILMK